MVHENRAVAFENMSAALETCQLKTCSQEPGANYQAIEVLTYAYT